MSSPAGLCPITTQRPGKIMLSSPAGATGLRSRRSQRAEPAAQLALVPMSAGLPHNEIAAQIARQAGLVDLSSVGHARKKVRELSPTVIAVPVQHGMPVCCVRTHRAYQRCR